MLFVLNAQKYNQNNFATLLNSSDVTSLSCFFGHDMGFKLVFGLGPGSGLNYADRLQLCCGTFVNMIEGIVAVR